MQWNAFEQGAVRMTPRQLDTCHELAQKNPVSQNANQTKWMQDACMCVDVLPVLLADACSVWTCCYSAVLADACSVWTCCYSAVLADACSVTCCWYSPARVLGYCMLTQER
jgi:hypothetical protein